MQIYDKRGLIVRIKHLFDCKKNCLNKLINETTLKEKYDIRVPNDISWR